MGELILKDESYAIMWACFEVYKELGPGFLEAVYHEALEHELTDRGIPHVSKPRLAVKFKDRLLTTPYEADFLCFDQITLELKAVREIAPKHEAQLIHYLRTLDVSLGILLNFGHYPDLQYKRFVRTGKARTIGS